MLWYDTLSSLQLWRSVQDTAGLPTKRAILSMRRCDHNCRLLQQQPRSPRERPGCLSQYLCHAAVQPQDAIGILDGNFLAQLEHLPHAVAQQLLGGIDRADVARIVKTDSRQLQEAVFACCRSVENVLQIMDRSLSVLWPPP